MGGSGTLRSKLGLRQEQIDHSNTVLKDEYLVGAGEPSNTSSETTEEKPPGSLAPLFINPYRLSLAKVERKLEREYRAVRSTVNDLLKKLLLSAAKSGT